MSYPAHLASDVVLRDGSTVSLRPVRPEDAPLLLEFFRSLDERSLAFRFFTGAPGLEEVARILADVDYRRRFGLVGLRGEDRHPVAHGFFAAIDDQVVEIAFAVSPGLQGHGLGSVLLAQLAERAEEEGFDSMVADVLPQNHAMISMFRDSGFPVEVRSEPEAVVVEMPTSPAPEAIARFQERDSIAARAAAGAFFEAGSVGLIDAAPDAALAAARGLAEAGVRAVVVRGDPDAWREAGRDEERELLEICRRAGRRLIGPGSLGVLDNRPGRRLNLTAVAELPRPGGVGIVAQGAAAGQALLDGAVSLGIGVSSFVSLGDRADVTANDLLEYWEEDPATEVALLQVESFSDPRRFARVARRVGAHMPIVVIAERQAAEPPGRGLFEQVGAIRAGGVAEALELATDLLAGLEGEDGTGRAPTPPSPAPPRRSDEAAAILAAALADDGAELDRDACAALLDCYGIELDETTIRPSDTVPLSLRIDADPLFGPVLRCGRIGEPMADQPARLCPLGVGDAAALLRRGAAEEDGSLPVPINGSVQRLLEAAAAAAASHAEIAELEIDLLLPHEGVVGAVTARVWVRRPPERRPWPRTWD